MRAVPGLVAIRDTGLIAVVLVLQATGSGEGVLGKSSEYHAQSWMQKRWVNRTVVEASVLGMLQIKEWKRRAGTDVIYAGYCDTL